MTTDADRYIEAYVRFHRRANRERGTAGAAGHGSAREPAVPGESAGATAGGKPSATTLAQEDAARAAATKTHRPEPIDWDDKLTHAALAELKEDLYRNLDTLDGKASGLLSYCGLVLAGSAILLDRGGNQISVQVIAFVAVTAAVSALLGVFVLFVKWTPTDRLERDRTIDACRQYFGVRKRRTRLYIVSWMTIVLSTAAFIFYLGVSLATGNVTRTETASATDPSAATEPEAPPPAAPGD